MGWTLLFIVFCYDLRIACCFCVWFVMVNCLELLLVYWIVLVLGAFVMLLLIVLWYCYLPGITFACVRMFSLLLVICVCFIFCLCCVFCLWWILACLCFNCDLVYLVVCCLFVAWLVSNALLVLVGFVWFRIIVFTGLSVFYKLLIVLLLCGIIWTWSVCYICYCLLLVVICLFRFVVCLRCRFCGYYITCYWYLDG